MKVGLLVLYSTGDSSLLVWEENNRAERASELVSNLEENVLLRYFDGFPSRLVSYKLITNALFFSTYEERRGGGEDIQDVINQLLSENL